MRTARQGKSTTTRFGRWLVVPSVRLLCVLAVFTHTHQARSGSCERPQQSTHTETLSSPSERHLHNEDMRQLTAPSNENKKLLQSPHKLNVAPLRKDHVECLVKVAEILKENNVLFLIVGIQALIESIRTK